MFTIIATEAQKYHFEVNQPATGKPTPAVVKVCDKNGVSWGDGGCVIVTQPHHPSYIPECRIPHSQVCGRWHQVY